MPFQGVQGGGNGGGQVDAWLAALRTCSSPELDRMLLDLSPGDRALCCSGMHQMKEGLIEIYSSKFGMWKRLPYILLGIGHTDVPRAQECARAALGEWNSAPRPELVHRVAVLLWKDPIVRSQLQRFAYPSFSGSFPSSPSCTTLPWNTA